MDPFLSDRHARWHPVGLSLFPLRPSPLRPSIITRSLSSPRRTRTQLLPGFGAGGSARSPGFVWLLDARSSSAVKGSPQACPVKSGILAINAAFE